MRRTDTKQETIFSYVSPERDTGSRPDAAVPSVPSWFPVDVPRVPLDTDRWKRLRGIAQYWSLIDPRQAWWHA
jgi:hypothetical protein